MSEELREAEVSEEAITDNSQRNRRIGLLLFAGVVAVVVIWAFDYLETQPTHVQGSAATVESETKWCAEGNFKSCNTLAILYVEGRGVDADPNKAREIFQKACKGGYGESCFNLGILHRRAEEYPKGLALFELSCERGFMKGCYFLAEMYAADGDIVTYPGVTQDAAKAVAGYEKSCNGGFGQACFMLAMAYEMGELVTKDEAKAKALHEKGCKAGYKSSCR